MAYIANNLLKDEKVKYLTRPSPVVFGSTAVCLVMALLVYILGKGNPAFYTEIFGIKLYQLGATVLVLYAVYLALLAMVRYYTSEYSVTNKRVIIKVGLVRRSVFETFLARIEGIKVQQGVIGRIFNYGTITVVGTGGTNDSFRTVPYPLKFRHVIQQQLDNELREYKSDSN